MALFTFWQGDDYLTSEKMGDISIQKEFDVPTLSSVMGLTGQAVLKRLQEGNVAWILRVGNRPVSFGWLGRQKARIGELAKEIDIPAGNSYLWNFRTLEEFRGKGYYVQLLNAILRAEEKTSERLWIISAPENMSSFKGIVKAGFKPVGDIVFNLNNEVVFLTSSMNERSKAGADLLQLPVATADVRPCWRCVSKTMKKDESCDCHEQNLPCRCGNQSAMANSGVTIL